MYRYMHIIIHQSKSNFLNEPCIPSRSSSSGKFNLFDSSEICFSSFKKMFFHVSLVISLYHSSVISETEIRYNRHYEINDYLEYMYCIIHMYNIKMNHGIYEYHWVRLRISQVHRTLSEEHLWKFPYANRPRLSGILLSRPIWVLAHPSKGLLIYRRTAERSECEYPQFSCRKLSVKL